MSKSSHTPLHIGAYELYTIECGRFRLDGGAMFGVVPRTLWEKTNPPDEKNRILMSLRSLLIVGNGRKILVDTGAGDRWSDKLRAIYAIDHSQFSIDHSLSELRLSPSDITDVIFTHLHFDHVGGSTHWLSEHEVTLKFPNARYFVQRGNLEHAHASSEKDRASFLEYTIEPIVHSDQVEILDGEHEFAPGVTAYITQGHTPFQQLVKVSDGRHTALFCGDTIPTSSHIPIPYVMAYDLYPLTTIEEKRRILSQAVAHHWTLIWAHDPDWIAGTVTESEGRFQKDKLLKSFG